MATCLSLFALFMLFLLFLLLLSLYSPPLLHKVIDLVEDVFEVDDGGKGAKDFLYQNYINGIIDHQNFTIFVTGKVRLISSVFLCLSLHSFMHACIRSFIRPFHPFSTFIELERALHPFRKCTCCTHARTFFIFGLFLVLFFFSADEHYFFKLLDLSAISVAGALYIQPLLLL